MIRQKISDLKEKVLALWDNAFNVSDEGDEKDIRREKIIVFIVAFIMALGLWFMVNLSRDYNLTVNMPIRLGNMPPDKALAEELPKFAAVSITGEGWKLINIYSNPPQVFVDVTKEEVNLYDQVQQQLDVTPDLNVQKVQPLFLNLDLEKKATRKVPVVPHVDVAFQDQYGFVGSPAVEPDSIVVSGAASIIDTIKVLSTDSVHIDDIRKNLSQVVALKAPSPLVTLSQKNVTFKAKVAQYTEGETRVIVQARNMPLGRSVSFSPSIITVRYEVPINEYAQASDLSNLVIAYVDYGQLNKDSTGFVVPNIEQAAGNSFHLRIRSFQPREVAYFMVIN